MHPLTRRRFLQWLSIAPFVRLNFLQQAQHTGFLLPPTVLQVTQTYAALYCWLAQTSANAVLVIETENEDPRHIALDSTKRQHLLEFDDLTPATLYRYWVEVDGAMPLYFEEEWGQGTFQTHAPAMAIRVAVIGDSGYGDPITPLLVGHLAERQPDLLLHLGDMVYNSDAFNNDLWLNWAVKYYQPFQPLLQMIPHYAAVGNHDNERDNRLDDVAFYYYAYPPLSAMPPFQERRAWYSFAVNDVQFLSLNTQTFYNERGLGEQTTWLEERLSDSTFRTNIIFSHIPLYTSSAVHPHDGDPVAQQWRPIFAEHAERIAVILGGHQHLYERLVVDGITHITSGGGSSVIYSKGEVFGGSQFIYSIAHYVWLEIDGATLQLSVYDYENNLLETRTWDI